MIRMWCAFFVLFTLVACSGVDSRIKKNQEQFNSWPIETQERLQKGDVRIGDTQEMVRIALGEPDETTVHIAKDNKYLVWAYKKSTPAIRLSLGLGSAIGRNVGIGGSVGHTVGGKTHYQTIINFELGKVIRIESAN